MQIHVMKIRSLVAIYSFFIGIAMIGIWTMFYMTGSIPEINTEPWRIGLHISAEIATGITLILGAWGLMAHKKFGFNIFLLSMGMLLYTLIASPGYYIDKGNMVFAGMFAGLFIITLVVVMGSLIKKEEIFMREF